MAAQGDIESVSPEEIRARAEELRDNGHRLVQIDCTLGEAAVLTYSFGKDLTLTSMRVTVPLKNGKADPVGSISDVFAAAALYENELHDLFGIDVEGMKPDFEGRFITTTVRTPYAPQTGDAP